MLKHMDLGGDIWRGRGVEINSEKSSPVALSITIVFRVVVCVWGVFSLRKSIFCTLQTSESGRIRGSGDNQDESVIPL